MTGFDLNSLFNLVLLLFTVQRLDLSEDNTICGLTGIIGDVYQNDIKIFKQLLAVTYLRGEHATGVTCVKTDGTAQSFKRALNPIDLMEMKRFDTVVSMYQTEALLGHCRQATVGNSDSHENAHPFEYEHVTMMHNGTLSSRAGLEGDKVEFPVDSDQIAYSLNCHENTKDVVNMLENIEGAFALVWSDSRDKTINIARNSDRELYYAISKVGKLYYASEREMLSLVLNRNSVKLEGEITKFPVGVWYKFKYTEKGDDVVDTVKFTPKVKPKVSYGNYSEMAYGSYHTQSQSKNNSNTSGSVVHLPANQTKVLKELGMEVEQQLKVIPIAIIKYNEAATAYVAVKCVLDESPWCDVIIHGIPSGSNFAKAAINKDKSSAKYTVTLLAVDQPEKHSHKVDKDLVTLVAYNPIPLN